VAIVAVIVGVGIVIAMARGEDDTTAGDAPVFGEVTVEGAPLPELTAERPDPAAGQAAPVVRGSAPDGTPVTIGGPGEPALIAFLAHWCPHCQAEVPVIVDLDADGGFEGVRTVAVLTQSNEQAPNFPPVPWLEREGWPGDVMLDDESASAALAYGLSGFPMLVAVDRDGDVVARTSGEVPVAGLEALADAARGGAG
jgi:thiol-disulfide isomerase/thioredoxin